MKLNPFSALLLGIALALASTTANLPAQGDTTLRLEKWADQTKLIPISITGFSGEAASTLRFDLEVMGCKVVTSDQASYAVSGNTTANLQGFLNNAKDKTQILGKAYAGGNLRSQVHTFADDIIFALTGVKGIAQTKITFKVDTGKVSEIFIADFDAHNPIQVTRDGSICSAPCWVPGQRALLYNSYKSGFPDIYLHELSGTRKVVARYSGSNITPAASPDGRRVAMVLSKGGSPNIYVSNIDGSGLLQLTHGKDGDSCPSWSPDGSKICFVSRQSGRAALYTVPSTGGQTQRLSTSGVINATEPDWSPDGKWIAFTAQMGSFQICVIPATGGEAKVLVAGADPFWAPNSRNLVFTRESGRGLRGLSLLDVPTKQVKDCTPVAGSNSQPSWGR